MRKSISFDIDTKITEKVLGDATNIYKHIGKYLKEHGFYRQQGSVYISFDEITHQDVLTIVIKLYEKYPYMRKCVRDIITQSVGEENSLNYLGEYDGTLGEFSMENTINTNRGPIPKEELQERVLNGENIKLIKKHLQKTKYEGKDLR